MKLEKYAFKEIRELSNIDKDELLEIIDFLQKDRKQWIEQFTKTHNESIDLARKYNNLEKENQQLKNELEQSNAVADTNKELAESYYKEIERLKGLLKCDYEDGQTIIAELTTENKQLKEQLQQRDNIISASINKYIKEYEQKIDFEIDMGSQGEYKKIKCYEEFINKLNDLKNILEKSDNE